MFKTRRSATAAAFIALTALAVPLSTNSADAADAQSKSRQVTPTQGRERAEQALESAKSAIAAHAGGSSAQSFRGTDPHGFTMALRDLALNKQFLTGADRTAADALLARPTDRGSADPGGHGWPSGETETASCGGVTDKVCIHYISKVTYPNSDVASDPTFANNVKSIAESVLASYAAAGYRAPKPDDRGAAGADTGKLDVYLTNLGPSLFGYCTSDDPNVDNQSYPGYDTSAYCVVDNNFSQAEYSTEHTPDEYADVTLAHELFHAVQFSYDFGEDQWLMEATATWAEDQLYDAINDNRSYLSTSPLRSPGRPLDYPGSSPDDLWVYGDWMFFQYLSERYPAAQGGMPTIVRSIWQRADDAATSPDPGADAHASIFAVKGALYHLGASLVNEYGLFGARNRHPKQSYSEGAFWPSASPENIYYLKSSARTTGWQKKTLNHLSTRTIRFVPSSLSASNWKVRISLDLPSTYHGSGAVVQIYKKSGGFSYGYVTLDSQGRGSKTLPFSSNAVWSIELTLTNAGTRFTCWQGYPLSCQGKPLDDAQGYLYAATAFQG